MTVGLFGVTVAVMTENVRKLVGVVAMAVLVVVGVVVSSGDDTDYTRNVSFRDNPGRLEGGDRLGDPDCCDQNAYEISLLQAKYEDLQNEIALLKGNYEALADGSVQYTLGAYPPAPPSVQTVVDAINESCPGNEASPYLSKVLCYNEYLAGFEIEFARQVVISQGEFGFHHVYVKGGYLTEEACGPIFYGYGPPPRWALLAHSVDGILVSYVTGMYVSKASKQSALSGYGYSWENHLKKYNKTVCVGE